MIDLGPLDRTAILYTNTPATGLGGVVTYVRAQAGTVFLSKWKSPTITRLAAERDSEQADVWFRSRWFDGLANGMLLGLEGHIYRILWRDELGRREGWEIKAREVS